MGWQGRGQEVPLDPRSDNALRNISSLSLGSRDRGREREREWGTHWCLSLSVPYTPATCSSLSGTPSREGPALAGCRAQTQLPPAAGTAPVSGSACSAPSRRQGEPFQKSGLRALLLEAKPCSCCEHSAEVPRKVENRIAICSGHPSSGYLSGIIEGRVLKRCLHTHVHGSVIRRS